MKFRKTLRRRFEMAALEPRCMLSASPAITPATIQVQYTHDQTLTALYETVDSTGSIFTGINVTAANETQQQTGSPLETDDQTSLSIGIFDVADGVSILAGAAVSQTQALTVSPDLRSAQLSATFQGVDGNLNFFNSTVTLTFTAPKSVASTEGLNPDETNLQGDGQSNALEIIRNSQVNGSVTGALTVTNDPDFPNTTFYFNSTTDVAAGDFVADSDQLTISGLPPTPTKALAAISTIQGQNNLGGLAGGIGGFQALLDQDALLSLPALNAFPADATQWLESAVFVPSFVPSGQISEVSAYTQQCASADFDDGSATQDINAQATIATQTNLLPLPKSTVNTGNLAFSVQSLAGGASTATGEANGGISIAGDASSASYSTTASLPATDASGDPLGNVNASAKLNWKEAPGPASFEYDVTTQSSASGGNVEFDDQITFPATVTGTLKTNLPGYRQPPLLSGSLSQNGDLQITTTVPAKPAVANLFSAVKILPALAAVDPVDAQILLGLLNTLDGNSPFLS
ncbi:MAG: hypothetical protein ABSF29_11775 [Tepidisphaeraceae bacterium]|jgi:hypothetical protein